MRKIASIVIMIILFIITGCSNKEVNKYDYNYKGENELWSAEYKVKGKGSFSKVNGKIKYVSETNNTLTVTYKKDIFQLSSVKHIEISYKSNGAGGKLTEDYNDSSRARKTYTLKSEGNGAVELKDEIIKVSINLDGKVQTIHLKNVKVNAVSEKSEPNKSYNFTPDSEGFIHLKSSYIYNNTSQNYYEYTDINQKAILSDPVKLAVNYLQNHEYLYNSTPKLLEENDNSAIVSVEAQEGTLHLLLTKPYSDEYWAVSAFRLSKTSSSKFKDISLYGYTFQVPDNWQNNGDSFYLCGKRIAITQLFGGSGKLSSNQCLYSADVILSGYNYPCIQNYCEREMPPVANDLTLDIYKEYTFDNLPSSPAQKFALSFDISIVSDDIIEKVTKSFKVLELDKSLPSQNVDMLPLKDAFNTATFSVNEATETISYNTGKLDSFIQNAEAGKKDTLNVISNIKYDGHISDAKDWYYLTCENGKITYYSYYKNADGKFNFEKANTCLKIDRIVVSEGIQYRFVSGESVIFYLAHYSIQPKTASDAASLYLNSVKERNGVMQYYLLSKEERKASIDYMVGCAWVTGVSSPHIDSFTVENEILKNDEYIVNVKVSWWVSSEAQPPTDSTVTVIKEYGEYRIKTQFH